MCFFSGDFFSNPCDKKKHNINILFQENPVFPRNICQGFFLGENFNHNSN